MEFIDYYKTLGVTRNATDDEIKRAFRKKAREFHPDVNKSPDAEPEFKRINEAYEVLKDKEKRRQYDTLGKEWKSGGFRPPPGWKKVHPGGTVHGFSDFFDMFFGQGASGFSGGVGASGGGNPFGGASPFSGGVHFGGSPFGDMGGASPFGGGYHQKGQDVEAEFAITLEDAFHGAEKTVTLSDGTERKSYTIQIPKGVKNGQKIRMAGQGRPGAAGMPSGDLFIKIALAPHARFTLDGSNLTTRQDIPPHLAALGGPVEVTGIDGAVTVQVPPGTVSGSKLRLKQKGMPMGGDKRGDLFVELRIVPPKSLSDEARELYEKLRDLEA